MKFILHCCLICCIIGDLLQLSVNASVSCPKNFTYISNKCLYAGPKSNWLTAAHSCSQFEDSLSLIHMTEIDVQHLTLFFLNKQIKSVWIAAKRNGPFEPIIYQLLKSSDYGRKISEFKQTYNMWLDNEPSHVGEESCMAAIVTNSTSKLKIHSKMYKCNESHNYACIINPCDSHDYKCQRQEIKQDFRQIKSSAYPKIEIRKMNNRYYLDVYNPQKLWNFTNSTSQTIKNPVCMLEDGNIEVNITGMLDPRKMLMWSAQNITENEEVNDLFQYSIIKQEYRVIIETEGYFVCRAFIANTMEQITTMKTIYRTDLRHHIFAVGLIYRVANCSLEICEPTYSKQYWVSLAQNLRERLKQTGLITATVQAVRMTNRTGNNHLALTFRVKILSKTSNEDVNADYTYLNELNSNLKLIAANNTDDLVDIQYVRSTKFCHEEVTHDGTTLHWRTATVGEIVFPAELCIDNDGILVQRQCSGDIIVGTFWSDERKQYKCIQPSPTSSYLFSLSEYKGKRSENASKTLEKLKYALAYQDLKNDDSIIRFAQVDIQSIARTIVNIQDNKFQVCDLPLIANITDTIMKIASAEKKVKALRNVSTQRKLNASNAILESLDHILNEVQLNNSEVLTITPRFVSLVMDIESISDSHNGIRGLAAVASREYSHFTKENIVTLPWNTSLENLLNMDVSAAVFLPSQLIENLPSPSQTTVNCNDYFMRHSNNSSTIPCSRQNNSNAKFSKRHRLVINMFWDDGLFKTTNGTPMHIISVTLDGVKHQDLNPPLVLIFNNSHRNMSVFSKDKDCVFWDFKANGGLGKWSDIGCTLAVRSNRSRSIFSERMDLCICTHLTHFGQLISPSFEDEINIVLDIITIIGCSASLLGLFGIGLTAIVIPEWRRGASKKIQLHLSASLAMLMFVFLLNALMFPSREERIHSRMCLFLGVVLHFAVISTFCWMLVAAWFQYLRLTKPLASKHRTPHILLKSGIFAWGLPLIPCMIVLIISPESYNSLQCYPSGMAHYLSVIIPVAIIISLNIWIFVLIVCSIYHLGKVGGHINLEFQYANNPKCQKSLACRRLCTLIFLFFLLGLSWIFGIWNLSYLFCSTASLQGFAFFVFFVILEKNTRAKWVITLTRKKNDPVYPMSSRTSLGSTIKRWSHISRRTSNRTVSTNSSHRTVSTMSSLESPCFSTNSNHRTVSTMSSLEPPCIG